jgi:undecaprenyl-phosphate 4-deoxy-4-formamido-L-arabinose transferase
MNSPQVTVVIPVYNEEAVLPQLFARLYPALDALDRTYEVIFVDDGSKDRSVAMLHDQCTRRPDTTRVAVLHFNAGQHLAILAGFDISRGQQVITLDADLQNPPEEIHKILAAMDAGHDVVGSIRTGRQDPGWRRWASKLMNRLRDSTTGINITDQGCMLRGYSRGIVDLINRCPETNTFVPALAYVFARSPVEIDIAHEERAAGTSKYSLYRLIRLNFDLMTGFSLVPLQFVSMTGIVVSMLSVAFFVFLVVRRLVIGPEAEGLFTLFSIAFFLLGLLLFAVGLIGEYIGRIYQQVRSRPRFLVSELKPDSLPAERSRIREAS